MRHCLEKVEELRMFEICLGILTILYIAVVEFRKNHVRKKIFYGSWSMVDFSALYEELSQLQAMGGDNVIFLFLPYVAIFEFWKFGDPFHLSGILLSIQSILLLWVFFLAKSRLDRGIDDTWIRPGSVAGWMCFFAPERYDSVKTQ